MANTLYEYYTGKGKTLPSLSERSKLYEQYGLGSAGTYGGTAEQNTALLNKLTAISSPPPASANVSNYLTGKTPSTLTPTTPLPAKPVEPQPMVPLIPAGQNFIKARQDAGRTDIDELTIKQQYRDRGFESKYGAWTGSAEQYKAMNLQDIQEGINKVSAGVSDLTKKVATEGITSSVKPPPSVSNIPTEEFKNPTPTDYESITQDVLDKVGTADITTLIQDFSKGNITTPELVLSKEDKDAQLASLKSAAAQGLSTIQKSLAQRGMTFSGIRTQEEADFAADVLSKESGINREFAGKIIAAARQEQTRRENTLQVAENNYNKALEAQGYVYNPITNTIEKTLAREQFETKSTAKTFSSGGGYYEYDPETGAITTLVEPGVKSPQTLNTDQGIMEWNPSSGEWEPTGFYSNKGDMTQTEKDQANIQQYRNELNYFSGTDGYVSPEDWNNEKKKWLDSGNDEASFVKEFIDKVNPNEDVSNYGMDEKNAMAELTFSTDLQTEIANVVAMGGGWFSGQGKAKEEAIKRLIQKYPTKASIITSVFEGI